MSDQRNGGIAWTDETWNPIRGCSKVSQGCKNCYAETMGARFSGAGQPYADVITNGRWNGKVVMVPEHLADPLRWTRPRRAFVNSMSDLFHESLTNEQIAAVFGVMAGAPQHTFQVLTKRPDRARKWFEWIEVAAMENAHTGDNPWTSCHYEALERDADGAIHRFSSEVSGRPWPLPNVWLGVSVEDQKTADERIPLLLQCPAAVRWVSAEPLLGPVTLDLREYWTCQCGNRFKDGMEGECINGCPRCPKCWTAMGGVPTVSLDWLVVGGESGPGARPMHPDWAQSLRDQCKAAGVPFLFKQWGDWAEYTPRPTNGNQWGTLTRDGKFTPTATPWADSDEVCMVRVGKKAAGRLLDGVLHDEYPSPTDACLMKADRLRAEVTAS